MPSIRLLEWLGRGLPGSAFVGPDKFRDRKDRAPEDPLQLPHASARRKPKVLAHRMELEAVAVASVPTRRAWPPVADRAEVVAPLQRCCLPVGKPTCVRGDAPGEPMDEAPGWRVRIVQDQCERPRPPRWRRPRQWWRVILAVAGVAARDGPSRHKGAAREREPGHSEPPLRTHCLPTARRAQGWPFMPPACRSTVAAQPRGRPPRWRRRGISGPASNSVGRFFAGRPSSAAGARCQRRRERGCCIWLTADTLTPNLGRTVTSRGPARRTRPSTAGLGGSSTASS